jgi:SAM-dependent methyltransferase
VTARRERDHYSYTVYADPATARTFDDRRFGGPIGALVADTQARVLVEAVASLGRPSVLDVGTGTGRAALLLARQGARVTGIDASEEMLAVARRRAQAEGLDIVFRPGDAHRLDAPDRSADAVVCLRVIMHTPDWRASVQELCRVADKLLILDFPSARSAALVESLARRAGHAVGLSAEPYRVFRLRSVEAALAASGFRVRTIHRQFVLPIALHKAVGSAGLTVRLERALGAVGLRTLFGSPITLIAERCAS